MVFHDFLYNGKSDSGTSLSGVPGGVRSVKTIENVRNITLGNSFSVVLYLNPDRVHLIQNAKINLPASVLAFQILHTVADDIVNDPLHLLRIRNHLRSGSRQVHIVESDSPALQIHADLFDAVTKIIRYVDFSKMIGDAVIVDPGIQRQLVDQIVHIVRFIQDGADIVVLLFARIL